MIHVPGLGEDHPGELKVWHGTDTIYKRATDFDLRPFDLKIDIALSFLFFKSIFTPNSKKKIGPQILQLCHGN